MNSHSLDGRHHFLVVEGLAQRATQARGARGLAFMASGFGVFGFEGFRLPGKPQTSETSGSVVAHNLHTEL